MVLGVGLTLTLLGTPANADGGDPVPDPVHEGLKLFSKKTLPGLDDAATRDPDRDSFTAYDDGVECPGPRRVFFESFEQDGSGRWVLVDAGCGNSATVPDRRPVLTPDRVLEAVRRIGLPSTSIEVPPKTLVNYETTVYTEPVEFTRTVTLLGYTVDVRARPSQFAWHYGDGEVDYTDGPGAPHPSDEVTHTWEDAHRTFRPRVDTTYTASYRVDGGPWLDIGDTITVTGPESRVRIKEASPRLS